MTIQITAPAPAQLRPVIDDHTLIRRGFALGCIPSIDSILRTARQLGSEERARRAAVLAQLWSDGAIRVMDEGLLADALLRNTDWAMSTWTGRPQTAACG